MDWTLVYLIGFATVFGICLIGVIGSVANRLERIARGVESIEACLREDAPSARGYWPYAPWPQSTIDDE